MQFTFADILPAQAAAIHQRQIDMLAELEAGLGAHAVSDKIAQGARADSALAQLAFQLADDHVELVNFRTVNREHLVHRGIIGDR